LEVVGLKQPVDPALAHLDAGEREAISLASELQAILLLMDFKLGNCACRCIYIGVYISGRRIMAIARVFKSGNSQAVRLPKKFRVKSSEVEIFRRGDEIVLREKAGGMVRVLDLLAELPADMFPKKRKDPHPQRRKGL
jgi:antitoxin VapB